MKMMESVQILMEGILVTVLELVIPATSVRLVNIVLYFKIFQYYLLFGHCPVHICCVLVVSFMSCIFATREWCHVLYSPLISRIPPEAFQFVTFTCSHI